MEDLLAGGLLLILGFGVMTAWVEDPWAVYLLYALVFGLGGVWALARLIHPRPIRFNVPAFLLVVVACWGAAQLLFGATVNRWETMNAALVWTASAVVYLVALQIFSTMLRRERFLRWLLYGGVALAVEALLQLYTADRKIFWIFRIQEGQKVIMGPVRYHNHYAAIIMLVLPIGVYFALRSAKDLLSYGWMAGLLAGSVFASEARSGSVLVVLEIVVLLVSAGKARSPKVRLATGGVILVLVALGGAVAGWEQLWIRLHQGDNTRVIASITSLEMIRQSPLRGSGLGTWPTVYPMFAHFDDGLFMNQGHNDWFQWAVEGGVPFAVLLACLAAIASVPAFRLGWGLGIPAVLLLCFVDFPLQKPAVSILLFTLAGAVATRAPVALPASTSPEPRGYQPKNDFREI